MNSEVVVACPIKDDNEYLEEYVEHYLALGFDKIYFYDNNDDDSIHPKDVFKSHIKRSKVEIINYRNQPFSNSWHREDFFANYDFEWVLFVDDDEFLELVKHRNIKDFLKEVNDNVTKVAINNVHYGDNDECLYKPGKVQERFASPLPLDSGGESSILFNSAIKSLLRKVDYETVSAISAHILKDDRPYFDCNGDQIKIIDGWRIPRERVDYSVAYIKHYCTKSLEEFIRTKFKRTMDDNFAFKNRYHFENYYFVFNTRTLEKERMIKLLLKKYVG